MNTQFKKGALELCVLSQLVKGDKYGYELTDKGKLYQQTVKNEWDSFIEGIRRLIEE